MKNSNLNLGIKRIPYSKMLKSEVADYAEKTINLVGAYDIESVLIDPMYGLLKAKEPEIRILRLSYGIDTERLRAESLKAELMLAISGFKLKVRKLSRSKLALDVHVIENAINNHLRYLHKCRNDKELAQKISGFLDILTSDVELMQIVATFNLNDDIDAMSEAFSMLTLAWQKRVKMLSQRPNISTKVILKSLTEAIDNLFKAIEVSSLISPLSIGEPEGEPIDLVPMIEELSQLSEMYLRSISIRNANNKRKANQGKPGDGEGEGDKPTDESAGKPADDSESPSDGETGETPGTNTGVQTTTMKTPFGEARSIKSPSDLDDALDQTNVDA